MRTWKLCASNIGWKPEDDDAILGFLAERGFEALEVAPTRVIGEEPYAHDDEAHAWAAQVRERYGLEVVSLQSIWRGRTETIFDAQGAEALLSYTACAARFARAVGATNLVFGCPANRSVPEGHAASEADAFLVRCAAACAAEGAVFAVEANPALYGTNYLNTTPQAFEVVRRLHADGLGLNIDLGTIIANDEPVEELEAMAPYIHHVHVSEPHLAPLDPAHEPLWGALRSVLESIGYAGAVSLEMAASDVTTAKASIEALQRTFG